MFSTVIGIITNLSCPLLTVLCRTVVVFVIRNDATVMPLLRF